MADAALDVHYGADYYRSHFGPIPYERSEPHWEVFFNAIARCIDERLAPKRVFDAGSGIGFLVEALRRRGIEAYGRDISQFAIDQVPAGLKAFCEVGSIDAAIEGRYDLITCIEVLEHMHEAEGSLAIDQMCKAANQILISSTPDGFDESTHVNVQPPLYWLQHFARNLYGPSARHDASYISPWAMLLERRIVPPTDEELQAFATLIQYRVGHLRQEASLREKIEQDKQDFEAERASRVQQVERLVMRLGEQNATRNVLQILSDESPRSTPKETLTSAFKVFWLKHVEQASRWLLDISIFRREKPSSAVLRGPSSQNDIDNQQRIIDDLIDDHWYIKTYPDTKGFPGGSTAHFLLHGWEERRNPNPFFYTDWYLSQHPELVATKTNPLIHYISSGWRMGFSPSPGFDTAWYLQANPDVAAEGMEPLTHYLKYGAAEGRRPSGGSLAYSLTQGGLLPLVRYRVDRSSNVAADEDWLLFVAYAPSGRLSRCQTFQIQTYVSAGFRVVAIINSDDFDNMVDAGPNLASVQIVRENIGFDFRGWADALYILGGLAKANSVTFTNDSIYPLGADKADQSIANLRRKIMLFDKDVVFLTSNREVKKHAQSYFFTFKNVALEKGLFDLIIETPTFREKIDLIKEVELVLADRISQKFSTGVLFQDGDIGAAIRNPTIWHWKELIEIGFPFLKIQLLTAGIAAIDDPDLAHLLSCDDRKMLQDHCADRLAPDNPVELPLQKNIQKENAPFNEHGAQRAVNPPDTPENSIRLPLVDISDHDIKCQNILGIIHCFYVDVAGSILSKISNLKMTPNLILTTDTVEKGDELKQIASRLGLSSKVIVTPNKGRNVAPLLVEGAAFIRDADLIFHLHTKKSPHDEIYREWGSYLIECLIGSDEIVDSIISIFEIEPVGIVYPKHYSEILSLRNWGFDFPGASELAKRMGIALRADMLLDFPTGMMFWARPDALEPLVAAGLSYDDFPEEAGQIDGTLAHSIERLMLYVAESKGFSHVQVVSSQDSDAYKTSMSLQVRDLSYAFSRSSPQLLGSVAEVSDAFAMHGEIFPIQAVPSACKRKRFSIVVPSVEPAHIFGGVSTALKVAESIISGLPADADIRVIVTSGMISHQGLSELSRRLKRSVTLCHPRDDKDVVCSAVAISAGSRAIPVRPHEVFLSTAWWTADLALRLRIRQKDLFGFAYSMIYLIQDFEPGFYPWSTRYALAEATYREPAETTALINSEELACFMEKFRFQNSFYIPFVLNDQIRESLTARIKEKTILVYGRPSVDRNCFTVIVESLRLWQRRDMQKNGSFKVIFAGEQIDDRRTECLLNASVVGKLSLDEYADNLSRSAVGLSLMVSPHPSYPPLEMAAAGCITITNGYECKDLSVRASNIISIDAITVENIANALDKAVAAANFETLTTLVDLKAPSCSIPLVNYSQVSSDAFETRYYREPAEH